MRVRRKFQPGSTFYLVLSTLLFLGIWEAIGRSGHFFAITPMTVVIPTMFEGFLEGELLEAVLGTLVIAGIGLVISILVAIPVGIATGASRRVSWVLDPIFNAGFAMPSAILLPVVGLYLGLGIESKLFMVFVFCFFVMVINTATGVKTVAPAAKEMARSFGMSGRQIAFKIVLRGASPAILTGIRIGVSRAVQGAVLADLLLAADNIGLYLINAGSTFDVSELLAGIVAITLVATVLMFAAELLEKRLMRWKFAR
jgi:ABC-type nitrate/sulfonate/bicarbonate transport system permease component